MTAPVTAKSIGAVSCHVCGLLVSNRFIAEHSPECPRCEAALHSRKSNSLSRTWALLIAAGILYVPANVYPVLTLISFGKSTTNTIMGGVLELAQSGQMVIAVIVFIASVFVPIFKILALLFLVVSVQLGMKVRRRKRALLYRFTEFIGRWSMIDIFMISILIALVKLQALATVTAGPGAIAFAAVVIITMFAAMTFDPRLIWDDERDDNDG
ncbi:paraquat-inducible protein A [Sneathiella litorea]|uniref:Paraquat-inducible membrane protein A n=1 Tax=Sneathiella litorea TaxID=2606216 RepID=A0A6L8WBM8_9PROT|nr:paraquat-inducible protein A [Sneathiella litorea]MZR31880.1 paraquat-inducible membrane protein A [Sneathiella litorea]